MTETDGRIRRAVPDDDVAIVTVSTRTWRVAYTGVVPQHVLDQLDASEERVRFQHELLERSDVHAFVAEVGGCTVGFATAGPDRGSLPSCGEIYALYVLPEHWSTGLGRTLATAAFGALRGDGFERVGLWVLEDNPRARRFYVACGLALTGERQMLDIGGPLPEVRYGGIL